MAQQRRGGEGADQSQIFWEAIKAGCSVVIVRDWFVDTRVPGVTRKGVWDINSKKEFKLENNQQHGLEIKKQSIEMTILQKLNQSKLLCQEVTRANKSKDAVLRERFSFRPNPYCFKFVLVVLV